MGFRVLGRAVCNLKRGTTATQKATPFRFFDLPGEIRNRIYEICITDFAEPDTLYWCNRVLPPLPASSCVSRLIRYEYLSLFDGQDIEYSRVTCLHIGCTNWADRGFVHFLEALATTGKRNEQFPKGKVTFILTKAFSVKDLLESARETKRREEAEARQLHHLYPLEEEKEVFDYRRFRRARFFHLLLSVANEVCAEPDTELWEHIAIRLFAAVIGAFPGLMGVRLRRGRPRTSKRRRFTAWARGL